jgi:uncharacterized protein (TIGR02996 family)
MSDHDALLAAVFASPDDDLPRLVFADWLEETGHPANAARAQYIRAQVEVVHQLPGSDAWLELNRRSADLRDRFRDEWDTAFADPNDWRGYTVARRRGFVDEVKISLERLAVFGPTMFASAPVRVLRVVTYDSSGTSEEEWTGFRRLKCLGGVRVLQFGPAMFDFGQRDQVPDDAPLVSVLGHRHLGSVRQLVLTSNALNDRFIVRFVSRLPDAAFADTLRELTLSGNEITEAGANTLAAARGLDQLERLILSGNRISHAGVALLKRRFGDRVSV